MIIVTGGAGFIGSCVVAHLNQMGTDEVIVVDELGTSDKWKNLRRLKFLDYLDKNALDSFLEQGGGVEAIIHMGACSATTERDAAYLMENNYRYTLNLARHALERGIRFIYASSAATYGDGTKGYSDDAAGLENLEPLNMYGYSKQLYDLRANREGWLDQMVGLKFFNVYGPNEYHKEDMTSVVYKAFGQIGATEKVKLFRSHRSDYEDGGQMRDFVYVKDVVRIIGFLLENPQVNGIFNLGTGQARSFADLAKATFAALGREPQIDYIDMPESIRDRYQYYTQADMAKLRAAGYTEPMHGLEEGIADYVKQYLARGYRHYSGIGEA